MNPDSELKARSKKQAIGVIQSEDYYNIIIACIKANRAYYGR